MVASAELQDLTDDQFDMNKNESSSEFPVSVRDSFLSTNVNVSSLKLVLDWLADRQLDCVEEEQRVASILITDRVKNDRLMDF